jgi:excisionase family DNA binding protein
MTVAEAADAIGVSSRHLYDLVRRGDFPAVRLGRRIVVPLSAVNEVLSSATTRMREEDAR